MITKLERDNLLHQNPNKKCKVVIYDDDFQKKELCINCIFEIRMNIKRQILVKEKKKKKDNSANYSKCTMFQLS